MKTESRLVTAQRWNLGFEQREGWTRPRRCPSQGGASTGSPGGLGCSCPCPLLPSDYLEVAACGRENQRSSRKVLVPRGKEEALRLSP